MVLATLTITLFLWIEARRYRYFELWSLRVRILEKHYFSRLLKGEDSDDSESRWPKELAKTLETQVFPITIREAFGRRYRSVYVWLQGVLAVSWIAHVWRFPEPVEHWSELWDRSLVGQVDLSLALVVGILFQLTLFVFGVLTSQMRDARGEVF